MNEITEFYCCCVVPTKKKLEMKVSSQGPLTRNEDQKQLFTVSKISSFLRYLSAFCPYSFCQYKMSMYGELHDKILLDKEIIVINFLY